ncbi:2-C-methyl-D-erythritol 4-phosphate cytidylyltransferase [Pseudoscardovia radai]|uniref:2-C-methyl-D-erythritol 4-phosphate cytidylyltransferase n=2 Tax=Pseudoscardovia radai TaxID=987066 RepID=A0A261F054_9BIFI|nr:2-C-methyl-D-erythritol 4-phosphate cytidylyltransferase [Pseudoscardovia radai]
MVGMSQSHQAPVIAIILAAGFGTRFDPAKPKQLVSVADRPVIEWTIEAFEDCPEVTDILVVVNAAVSDAVEKVIDDMGSRKVRGIVPGGETRADSTRAALEFLREYNIPDDAKVLIHDGVRPFVSPKTILDCVAALDSVNAATVAVPSTDTILIAAPVGADGAEADDASSDGASSDGAGRFDTSAAPIVRIVPDRATTYRAQTPQCFRFSTISEAYRRAAGDENFHPTDDTRVVVDYLPDEPVAVVEGSDDNIKITTRPDLEVAELIAPRARRVRNYARRRAVQEMTSGM